MPWAPRCQSPVKTMPVGSMTSRCTAWVSNSAEGRPCRALADPSRATKASGKASLGSVKRLPVPAMHVADRRLGHGTRRVGVQLERLLKLLRNLNRSGGAVEHPDLLQLLGTVDQHLGSLSGVVKLLRLEVRLDLLDV